MSEANDLSIGVNRDFRRHWTDREAEMAEQHPESRRNSTANTTRLKSTLELLVYMADHGLEELDLKDRTISYDRQLNRLLKIAASDHGAVRNLIDDGQALDLVNVAAYGGGNIFEHLAVTEAGYQLAIELSDACIQAQFEVQPNDVARAQFLSNLSHQLQVARRLGAAEIEIDGMPREIGDLARFLEEARRQVNIIGITDGPLPEARSAHSRAHPFGSSQSPVAQLIDLGAIRQARVDRPGRNGADSEMADGPGTSDSSTGDPQADGQTSGGSKSKGSPGVEPPARVLNFIRRQ